MSTVSFNSKSSSPPGFQALSNFHGGVEFEYMQNRFSQKPVLDLLDELEHCDAGTFLEWLKRLQPHKKEWTAKMEAYWFRDGEPIRGILAQMIGTVVKPGQSSARKKRILLQYFAERNTPLDSIETEAEIDDAHKRERMLSCLRHKFEQSPYRELLLSTGNAVLHEKPTRGSGNNWTFKVDSKTGRGIGGDWLGQLLMKVREELQHDVQVATAFRQFVHASK